MCLRGSRSSYAHPHRHCHPLNEGSLDLEFAESRVEGGDIV